MDFPIVLIISDLKLSSASLDIIEKIRKIPNDKNIEENNDSKLYIHDINTKYYSTKIAFYAVENFDELPESVSDKCEGIIIYFNPNDRSLLELLPKYVHFIKSRNIELSIMLCSNELLDDVKKGITFKCIKDCYNLLDVIELETESEIDQDDNDALHNPKGYDELEQALKSIIWSNVKQSADLSDNSQQADYEPLNDESEIENELEKFENLLSQVMQFRPNTSSMSRENRLNCAQNFAEVFEKLILQDEDNEHLSN